MQLKPHNCVEDQLRVIPAVAKPRREPWGPVTNCMRTHNCSVSSTAALNLGAESQKTTIKGLYERQILMMGLIGKYNLYWPPGKEYIRLESQTVN